MKAIDTAAKKPTKKPAKAKTKVKKAAAPAPEPVKQQISPEVFDDLVAAMQAHHDTVRAAHKTPMFTVNTNGLGKQWVEALGQDHNCDACRSFIRRMGGAVFVGEDGNLVSAVWPDLPESSPYHEIVKAIKNKVEHGTITSAQFVTSSQAGSRSTWASPDSGEYGHLNVKLGEAIKFQITNDDAIPGRKAESIERKKTLSIAIAGWDQNLLRRGLHLVSHDDRVKYGPTVQDIANFLWETKEALSDLKKVQASNYLWLKSTQFPGWAQPRGTAYGTFLENLSNGGEDGAIRELNVHTKPTNYQRPTAEATEGNIARAETLVKKLNLESALKRREATLDDIPEHGYIWKLPVPDADVPGEGVFGSLKGKAKKNQVDHSRVAKSNMTWVKFVATVLPTVQSMRFRVPLDKLSGGYLTAAVDDEAVPLFKWDYEDARNQLGFITYDQAHEPDLWSLKGGKWVDALAVVKLPWNMDLTRRIPKFSDGAVIVLKGARDTNNAGLGLFPVALRPELYEVRQTIENFSNDGELEAMDDQIVTGQFVHAGNRPFRLEVVTKTGTIDVTIDRFD